MVFHAGTKAGPNGEVLANGGRVLGVTAIAPAIAEAQARAYQAVEKIDWPEGFCRRDIGWRAVGH
jgi:phosphoribosylamine--glycine ligase